jgi:hypothetical protein
LSLAMPSRCSPMWQPEKFWNAAQGLWNGGAASDGMPEGNADAGETVVASTIPATTAATCHATGEPIAVVEVIGKQRNFAELS